MVSMRLIIHARAARYRAERASHHDKNLAHRGLQHITTSWAAARQRLEDDMANKNAPFHPIIYVRGYAMTPGEIDETTADPFCGFNLGSTVYRAVPEKERQPRKFIFESAGHPAGLRLRLPGCLRGRLRYPRPGMGSRPGQQGAEPRHHHLPLLRRSLASAWHRPDAEHQPICRQVAPAHPAGPRTGLQEPGERHR